MSPMDYYVSGFLVVLVFFYAGLFIADHKLARLQVATGGVVKKRDLSHLSMTIPGGPWMMSTTTWRGSIVLEVQAFVLDAKDRLRIETVVVPVSKAQYEEVSIGAIVYVKYWETRFFKNKALLDFVVLES